MGARRKNTQRQLKSVNISWHMLIFRWWQIFFITLLILLSGALFSLKNKSANEINDPIIFIPVAVKDYNYKIAPYPIIDRQNFPNITAKSYLVYDFNSGIVLEEKNSQQQMPPASLTKLMTALVALDTYSLDNVLEVPKIEFNFEGAEMGLVPGDKVTVESLLHGLLVPSGNDAAQLLAWYYPYGGVDGFVQEMNNKAKILGMTNTHFSNPSGIDEENHFSSASDLLILTKAALGSENIKKIVAMPGVVLGDYYGKKKFVTKNVNQLLGLIPGVDGVKTGYTDQAGQCLILSANTNGHRIITVVLRSADRFEDSKKLLNWALTKTTWQEPLEPLSASL